MMTEWGKRNFVIINESGLYGLIQMRSVRLTSSTAWAASIELAGVSCQ